MQSTRECNNSAPIFNNVWGEILETTSSHNIARAPIFVSTATITPTSTLRGVSWTFEAEAPNQPTDDADRHWVRLPRLPRALPAAAAP